MVAELRANNQQLTSLGMVTPIIATIKNIIDSEKVGNASKYIHPIDYQTRRANPITSGDETYDSTGITTTDFESKSEAFSLQSKSKIKVNWQVS